MKTLDDFVIQFVAPLIEGGTLHVGAPIDQPKLVAWQKDIDSSAALLLDRIDDTRHETISEIVLYAERPLFDDVDLCIVAGLYNMVALAHPAFARFGRRRRLRERVLRTALDFFGLPPAGDRTDALRRHSLVANVFAVSRQDTLVKWWTGRSQFSGQVPPERLLRWTALRRVEVFTEMVPFVDLTKGDPAMPAALLTEILRVSPLTDLLTLSRETPKFSWTKGNIDLLRDAGFARAVAYRLVGADLHAPTLMTTAGRAAAALRELLDDKAVTARDVRAVVAFVVHLNLLLAIAEVGVRGMEGSSPILRDALGDAPSQDPMMACDEGMKWLLALPQIAATAIDPVFLNPPGLDDDPRLRARWRAHRAQVEATCASEFTSMSTLLSAAIRTAQVC